MKNIAIIPARGGSKRLPNKNILLLGGIPLIAHSILFAKKNKEYIDEVYVSTDNAAIKEIALYFGAKVIDRPGSISGDLEPTVSALKHSLWIINDAEIENIIVLQVTNPLRPENILTEAFEILKKENYDSLFTVSRNNEKLGKIINKQFIPFNYEMGQRSQDLEPLYYENGLLYISKAKLILDNKIVDAAAFPMLLNHIFATVDIDMQDDFEYAEYLYQKHITPNS
ncbi:cytidylyltransferase domain-containing protein [Flavobacterium sp. LB2R40]|uniref:acylneuraminate cytidylyltransferase family protein n=1 Tax=Flavobacterium sp. LB2R40 TaxID=3401722 RepID=UPI003AAD8C9C